MKNRFLAVLKVGLLAGGLSLTLPGAVEGGDWQSLFNGRNLSGWAAVHDVTFEAQDGNLHLVRGMGWLRTEEQFQDFVLEFECRPLVERYDSGVFFRAGAEGKPWPQGGWQVNLRQDMLGALVKGYRARQKSPITGKPPGEWVRFRLTVQGAKATLDVDGQRAWEYDGIDAEKGFIGLQAENRAFDFRNLRIKRL